jgi:DNA polymerase III subunit beta
MMIEANIVEQEVAAEEKAKMQFKVKLEKAPIMKAMSHVQNVVEKRNIVPILSNVKLVARDAKLELTTTDMDLSVTEIISADVLEEGQLTIPAHTFYDIVRKLPDGSDIEIATSDEHPGKITVVSGNCNFSLSFLEAGDFPSMAYGELPFKFKLTSAELKALIDKNKFTISTEETRYNLNGIFFHSIDLEGAPVLRAVATDGHRLSCMAVDLPDGAKEMPGIIIPRKAVIELKKIVDDIEDIVDISLSDKKVSFAIGNIVLTTKLIDGNFPEYEALIPKGQTLKMEVNVEQLTKAVDRVTTINFEKTSVVKLSVNGGELTLSAFMEEQGSAEEGLSAQSNIENLNIGFNARYILDVMSVLEGDTVEFSFTDSFSPAIIRDTSDPLACFVIMPMRV